MNIQQLENELWEAADQLRANSKLTAADYSMPVLGLIFLRHADNRFQAFLPEITKDLSPKLPAAQREEVIKLGFQGKAAVYLPEAARFSRIVNLPQGEQVGAAIDAAMDAIETEHEVLKGALPRGYTGFEPGLLAELVKIFDRPAIKNATGDVFGRIYEYFLNKFAMTGAQEGGEFFTPPSLVRMIVNIIEPNHGVVLDPACGSAGMFVQTGHFIEHSVQPGQATPSVNDAVIFHGQEKSETNTRLARMNMVVHGLDASNIRQGNTFYDQIDHLIGGCDFVMANPPFNVDGVDTKRIEGQVGLLVDAQAETPTGEPAQVPFPLSVQEGVRLPFGLPGTNGKTGAISNANSLWIQYFYAYLNDTGRAGFVMASSASDAGNKDREIRERLIKTGHVDAMVAIGNKFFYTRSLPCTLWFFDKGKPQEQFDQVLMVDARNVYTVVSARSHVFTDEQLANLNAIVWLYRGESDKFVALLGQHQQRAGDWLTALPGRLAADTAAIGQLGARLRAFADGVALADLNADQPAEAHVTLATLAAFKAELTAAETEQANTQAGLATLLATCAQAHAAVEAAGALHPDKVALQTVLEALSPQLKATGKLLEARHKRWLNLLDTAEKKLRARLSKAFDGKQAREAKRALLAADTRRGEAATVRDEVLEALKQAVYFIHQGHWLHSRFPHALFEHVPGLCTVATLQEIKDNDYSLTPGRYVGVAASNTEDEDDFAEKLRDIHDELTELNEKASELSRHIARNFEELLG